LRKTFLQILKIAGFLALGILLLYFAFRGVALDELFSTLKRANFGGSDFLSYLLPSHFSAVRAGGCCSSSPLVLSQPFGLPTTL
jgi:hypothetical protein